jgi:hypothetical protein
MKKTIIGQEREAINKRSIPARSKKYMLIFMAVVAGLVSLVGMIAWEVGFGGIEMDISVHYRWLAICFGVFVFFIVTQYLNSSYVEDGVTKNHDATFSREDFLQFFKREKEQ